MVPALLGRKECKAMKGRRPTKKQKEIIARWNLNPQNWFVTRNLLHQGELHILHRHTGSERVIRCSKLI